MASGRLARALQQEQQQQQPQQEQQQQQQQQEQAMSGDQQQPTAEEQDQDQEQQEQEQESAGYGESSNASSNSPGLAGDNAATGGDGLLTAEQAVDDFGESVIEGGEGSDGGGEGGEGTDGEGGEDSDGGDGDDSDGGDGEDSDGGDVEDDAGGDGDNGTSSLPSAPVRPPAPPSRPRSPRRPPQPPPLELKIVAPEPPAVPERCVFVLGTGRSGSTSLVDALNQLPNYLIRGEQDGAFWYLYLAWRMLLRTSTRANDLLPHVRRAEAQFGSRGAGFLSYDTVKAVYNVAAVERKLPWFNDLHRSRIVDAVRAFYVATYGYHWKGIVSGFKEVRFVCGRAFPSKDCRYADFYSFIRFLRVMCLDVKVLFNSRASAAASSNSKLSHMLERSGLVNDTTRFEQDLAVTHSWYDRYVREHPGSGFRVIMEDMFNATRNVTLARNLLSFLKERPSRKIRFNRMPTWSSSRSNLKRDRPHNQKPDPWEFHHHHHRRHLSQLGEQPELRRLLALLQEAKATAAYAAAVDDAGDRSGRG